MNPDRCYKKRRIKFEQLQKKQIKTINVISNLRLSAFLAAAAGIIYSWFKSCYFLLGGIIAVFIFLFIYLVIQHDRLFKKKQVSSAMCEINEISLKRFRSEWMEFEDRGDEFRNEEHPYSHDLDIFGRGSLFQWINSAKTFLGRRILGSFLADGAQSPEIISKRQSAVKELAQRLPWRQRFWAEGRLKAARIEDPQPLIRWAKEHNEYYLRWWVKAFFILLPIFTISAIVFTAIFQVMPIYIPILMVVLQLVLLKTGLKKRSEHFKMARKYHQDIKVYYQLLSLFENRQFEAELLVGLRKKLQSKKGKRAYKQLDHLAKIIEAISNRDNGFFFFINLITLWDYHCLIALENWKRITGTRLGEWFEVIGQLEALSSLSNITYDHPGWVMPHIVQEDMSFDTKDMGHPLLPRGRVTNHLSVNDSARILLITGSNMSGKSTLLRTAGINLVLAYAGAAVCASSFRVSVMEIHTCMRVSDNLERNISSFYAELLRIKTIVGMAKEGKKLFFLLDEIFKGTNSRDRHTGARILIQNLCRTYAVGLVSTHDLELCALEKENGKVKNYHYSEYYKDNRIHFDYKLRAGASTTRNAIYLMRMAGIEITAED